MTPLADLDGHSGWKGVHSQACPEVGDTMESMRVMTQNGIDTALNETLNRWIEINLHLPKWLKRLTVSSKSR